MGTRWILVLGTAILAGCASSARQDISGAWVARLGGSEMLIQLDTNEHWSLWDMGAAPPPQSPTQEGRWFVHDTILVLRVEKSKSDKLPPGLAFTLDLRAATAARLTLYDRQMKKDIYWERSAN